MSLLSTPAADLPGECEDLRCPICFGLMLSPCRLQGCVAQHLFCYTCITMWLESCGACRTCPIDRRHVPAEEEVERVGRRAPDLLVRCPPRSAAHTSCPLARWETTWPDASSTRSTAHTASGRPRPPTSRCAARHAHKPNSRDPPPRYAATRAAVEGWAKRATAAQHICGAAPRNCRPFPVR